MSDTRDNAEKPIIDLINQHRHDAYRQLLDGVDARLEIEALREQIATLTNLVAAALLARDRLYACPHSQCGAGGQTISELQGRIRYFNVPASIWDEFADGLMNAPQPIISDIYKAILSNPIAAAAVRGGEEISMDPATGESVTVGVLIDNVSGKVYTEPRTPIDLEAVSAKLRAMVKAPQQHPVYNAAQNLMNRENKP